jgi:hypothetical protein
MSRPVYARDGHSNVRWSESRQSDSAFVLVIRGIHKYGFEQFKA